jgi:hypothetical protein
LQGSLAEAGVALAAFGINPGLAQDVAKTAGRLDKPLKAAVSNAGPQATWCTQDKSASVICRGSPAAAHARWFGCYAGGRPPTRRFGCQGGVASMARSAKKWARALEI